MLQALRSVDFSSNENVQFLSDRHGAVLAQAGCAPPPSPSHLLPLDLGDGGHAAAPEPLRGVPLQVDQEAAMLARVAGAAALAVRVAAGVQHQRIEGVASACVLEAQRLALPAAGPVLVAGGGWRGAAVKRGTAGRSRRAIWSGRQEASRHRLRCLQSHPPTLLFPASNTATMS